MSHQTGTIIISMVMPHNHRTEEERDQPTPVQPCIRLDLDEGCTETECVEAARRAYRKLTRRGD